MLDDEAGRRQPRIPRACQRRIELVSRLRSQKGDGLFSERAPAFRSRESDVGLPEGLHPLSLLAWSDSRLRRMGLAVREFDTNEEYEAAVLRGELPPINGPRIVSHVTLTESEVSAAIALARRRVAASEGMNHDKYAP